MLGSRISNKNDCAAPPVRTAPVALRETNWMLFMPFLVNSSPGAGLRFEPSATFPDAKAALDWAEALDRRGMRMVRIVDTTSGAIFDERGFRDEIRRLQNAT